MMERFVGMGTVSIFVLGAQFHESVVALKIEGRKPITHG